jgi:tripeptide aminopeptidase
MVNTDRMVAEFLEMVQVDSISGKERNFADLLKGKLSKLGMEPWEDNAGQVLNSSCGNIITKFPGNTGGPTLLLSAHMDTVLLIYLTYPSMRTIYSNNFNYLV